MSEYQYYEFQAIDRPLTEEEIDEVRSYPTRARITRMSFVNDYWGEIRARQDSIPASGTTVIFSPRGYAFAPG
jgi:hypothetical protein